MPTSPHCHLWHWGTFRTVTPVYLFPVRTRRPPGPTCTNFAVLQMFGDSFVHHCTKHFRTFFVHFANCEMSILSNDAVHLLLQWVCDDRGSPWTLSHVHNMFAIDCNKYSMNFTGLSACKNRITPRTSQSAGFDIGVFIVTTRYTYNVKKFAAPTTPVTIYTLVNTPHDWSGTMKQLRGLYAQTFFIFRKVLVCIYI